MLPILPDWCPKIWELFVLLLYTVCVLVIGYVLQKRWADHGDAVPMKNAIGMYLGLFVAYALLFAFFYQFTKTLPPSLDPNSVDPNHIVLTQGQNRPPDHRIIVLMWAVGFSIVPIFYYSNILLQAMATVSVDRIGPMSAHIEDPSEFSSARKLAIQGDVDGAIELYRNYRENRVNALLEAARLLRSEDRFEESADLFLDIADEYQHLENIWADATYQAAKIYELNLGDNDTSVVLLKEVVQNAPHSRFGNLAMTELSRIQVMDDDFLDNLPTEPVNAHQQDPFYIGKDMRNKTSENEVDEVEDEDEASPDPFYKQKKTPEKTVRKRKAAPKKKAAAKKKKATAKKNTAASRKKST